MVMEEYNNFDNMSTNDTFCTLMKPDIVKQTATYVKRRDVLYK